MKRLAKSCLWACLVLACLLAGGYVFLSVNAKKIFSEQAEAVFHRPVTVKAVYPVLPPGIVAEGVEVDGLFTAARLRVDVDFSALLRQELLVSRVVLRKAVILLERPAEAVQTVVSEGDSSAPAVTGAGAPVAIPSTGRVIRKVVVRDSELRLRDEGGQSFVLTRVQADLDNVPIDGSAMRTGFFVTASLEKLNVPFVGHFVKAKGWLDWAKRDMDGSAQAVDDNGRVGLEVTLKSVNNVMSVDGAIKMSGGQQSQASGEKTGLAENVVLGVLDHLGADVDMKFSFETQMDRFKIGKVQLKGNFTTGLNSFGSSGNIVANLDALGSQVLGVGKSND